MRSLEHSGLIAAKPFLIEQDYTKYTPDQHALWSELVQRRMAQLKQCACREYLEGWSALGLEQEQIPHLPEISKLLEKRTGWRVQPVSGFMPSRAFFEMLGARQFPTTTWLRSRESMDYTPEMPWLSMGGCAARWRAKRSWNAWADFIGTPLNLA
jgi:phenylalanine-4-hydroxylase